MPKPEAVALGSSDRGGSDERHTHTSAQHMPRDAKKMYTAPGPRTRKTDGIKSMPKPAPRYIPDVASETARDRW